jgi:hypothetical protein
MDSPVVSDEVHDLLCGHAHRSPKVRERKVITGLRLVREVLALAKPRLLKSGIFRNAPVQEVVRYGGTRVDNQWLVRELLFPFLSRLFLRFGFWYPEIVKGIGISIDPLLFQRWKNQQRRFSSYDSG